MLHDLAAQDSSVALARRLRRYTRPAILAVDEVGYLSYDTRYADLLFEVVTRRYEQRRPILLTTNKPFGEWNQAFPTPAVSSPLSIGYCMASRRSADTTSRLRTAPDYNPDQLELFDPF